MMSTLLVSWATVITASGATGPTIPQDLDLSTIRAIPVQHNGRWMPLDTLARDCVEAVTGQESYQDRDPVLMLLAWTFDDVAWRTAPLISIPNEELRSALRLPVTQTRFSFEELRSHRYLHSLVDDLKHSPQDHKPDPLEKKVEGIYEKLLKLRSIFHGDAIYTIPDPKDRLGKWRPILKPDPVRGGASDEVAHVWALVGTAFLAGDAANFAAASRRLAAVLRSLPAGHRPDSKLIETELRYNQLQPFRLAWQVMLIGALLSLAALAVRRRLIEVAAVIGLMAGFAVLTYGLSKRWQIAGSIPASNMFESLLFLGWGMGAFAIISMIVIRHRIVPITASVMGAVALMLADLLPMDHFIRPIAPVLLDTIWMSIHVPIIMVSYSVLTLAVLIAHVQLVAMALFPSRRSLTTLIDEWHYWYIHVGAILLLAGIVTGSMWAASSWGRYWGWDPKEVWSLVALLGYLTILHIRINRERIPKWAYGIGSLIVISVLVLIVPRLIPLTLAKTASLAGAVLAMAIFVLASGPFATAMKSILAFWLIVMTYVGVNYVLGTGLHSYGFGTGAVVYYLFCIGGVDLALVVLFCVVYFIGRSSTVVRLPRMLSEHGSDDVAFQSK